MRSNAPPHHGAHSTLNNHSIPSPVRYVLTVPSLIMYLAAALKVLEEFSWQTSPGSKPFQASDEGLHGLIWNHVQVYSSGHKTCKRTDPHLSSGRFPTTHIQRTGKIYSSISKSWILFYSECWERWRRWSLVWSSLELLARNVIVNDLSGQTPGLRYPKPFSNFGQHLSNSVVEDAFMCFPYNQGRQRISFWQ